MNKQRILFIYIFVAILLTSVFAVNAEPAKSGLLTRSSQVLKFEVRKAETIDFAAGTGNLYAFTQVKAKEAEQKESAPEKPTKSTGFSVSSEFIEAQNAYKLTITDSTGGGVLINNNALDQAPAEGYVASTEVLLPLKSKAYETKKTVYLKTKTGDEKIPDKYSRLELNMTVGKAKLIVNMSTITNPDGSTNLKEDRKARQKYITQRLGEIEKAIKNKTATDEQIAEMHELRMRQMEQGYNRWDFEGNRKRMMQQKRQRLLEADGHLRLKKEYIKKEETEKSATDN